MGSYNWRYWVPLPVMVVLTLVAVVGHCAEFALEAWQSWWWRGEARRG